MWLPPSRRGGGLHGEGLGDPPYLAELKEEHVKRRYPFGGCLELALKRSRASLERGAGPLEKAAEWDLRPPHGPVQQEEAPEDRAATTATGWLLREIENAAIRLHSSQARVAGKGETKRTRRRLQLFKQTRAERAQSVHGRFLAGIFD